MSVVVNARLNCVEHQFRLSKAFGIYNESCEYLYVVDLQLILQTCYTRIPNICLVLVR